TVCDDRWDLRDANVTCRYLGCGHALEAPGGARFGRGHDPIWLDEVECSGLESSLLECPAKPWGENNCFHGEDAGVVCSDLRAAPAQEESLEVLSSLHPTFAPTGEPESPQVRLVGGPTPCSGRVELFHLHRWGSVCDDAWDLRDAQVVCRQVSCGRALSAPGGAQFGRGEGIIWLDEVNCTGEETHLATCPARPWGVNDCYHGEDAGVVCEGNTRGTGKAPREGGSSSPGQVIPPPPAHLGATGTFTSPTPASWCAQVRLVDGPGACAGRVEVLHEGTWGTVCDDRWDFAAASVVCRHLSCGQVISAPARARFGQGKGPIWLDGVTCTGSEAALSECRHKGWGVHRCDHAEDAGVVCAGGVQVITWKSFSSLGSGLADLTHLRLVNGSHRCAGTVQVFHQDLWGGICADTWRSAAAQVVCRQVGCGRALAATSTQVTAPGSEGLTWVEAVECSGTEWNLLECQVKVWNSSRCRTRRHARVTC
ncbi:Deleted in malignant brain tumors 1 protein, partial [Acanthisitta chloris]